MTVATDDAAIGWWKPQRKTVHFAAPAVHTAVSPKRHSAPAPRAKRPAIKARLLTGSDDEEEVPVRAGSSSDAPRLSPRARASTSLGLLSEGRDGIEALNFEADDPLLAGAAFEAFYEAVTRATQYATKQHNEQLRAMEPKARILQFLLDLSQAQPLQRQRINVVVGLLVKFDAWQDALHSPDFLVRAHPAPAAPAAAAAAKSLPARAQPRRELFGFRRSMRKIYGRCKGCLGV